MPINNGLAALSNNLFLWAIVIYAVAMTCYAIEYAFGVRGLVASAAKSQVHEAAKVPVLIGAGGLDSSLPADASRAAASPARSGAAARWGARAMVLGRAAVLATVIGALCQLGSLIARGISVHRVPWGNMYEFVCVACLVGVTCWLIALSRRPKLRHLGLFVLLPVVLLLGLAGTVLYAKAAPLVPALNSVWLKIHVSAAATSSGIFMFGFVCGVLYLIRQGYDARTVAGREITFPFTIGVRLPSAESLERLTFRVHALAFPLWTFAVIAGSIWAEAAWTSYWSWDPKETWAFISWVVYAAYLHARATAGWRGKKAVAIVILGWGTMMVNLFVINLVQTGLHSYAGVS
ncbi:MAG TPA: c-type cytochrome biogenesis protein CcsB [Mycobacteriales bacterium]|nr:c-type cytochrome biogenesis protein CcsB [Mycobacteriales bacterium]